MSTETGDLRRPLRPEVLRERLLAPAGPVDRLQVVERAGSTNSELAEALLADPVGWGDVRVLVTEHQVDGRGRSGRSWQTPPAAALTFSVALRPPAPAESVGWLPLLAGLAAARGVRAVSGAPVTLKWPNDLMVDLPDADDLAGWGTERKVGGILAELVPTPGGPMVVLGIGLNVSQTGDELPVPSAQSLAGVLAAGAGGGPPAGGAVPTGAGGSATGGAARALDREELLVAVVENLADVVERWRAAGGDVTAAGLAQEVATACTTLGRPVQVDLPGGGGLPGTAVGLAHDGALLVRDDAGHVVPVRAGDVRHLRSGAHPDA